MNLLLQGPSGSAGNGQDGDPDPAPDPEPLIARDMARRALPLAAVPAGLSVVVWGFDGLASASFAVVLVVANFLASAWMLKTAARISYAVLMGAALFGYLLRLALVAAAVLAVRDAAWVEPVPLGLTLIVTHLGLLLWELRYISMSLAFPGLKPANGNKEIATR